MRHRQRSALLKAVFMSPLTLHLVYWKPCWWGGWRRILRHAPRGEASACHETGGSVGVARLPVWHAAHHRGSAPVGFVSCPPQTHD